jgi:aldehyde:ferredoxin oxidoreductase
MTFGYIGKILHVDLTKGSFEIETPDEAFYRTYMGGSAMGVYYVLRLVPKGADPVGPETCWPSSQVSRRARRSQGRAG